MFLLVLTTTKSQEKCNTLDQTKICFNLNHEINNFTGIFCENNLSNIKVSLKFQYFYGVPQDPRNFLDFA